MITELLSQRSAVVGTIAPSQQGTVESLTGAIDLSKARQFLAILKVGAVGSSAVIDACFKGATSAAGGYTAISGTAITQMSAAGIAKVVARTDQINALGLGYTHIKFSVTVGTAATFTDATVVSGDASYEPNSVNDLATVGQVVAL